MFAETASNVAVVVAIISLLGMLAGGLFTFVTAKRANKTDNRKVDTDEFREFTAAQNERIDQITAAHSNCEKELNEHRKQLREVWSIVRSQEEEISKCMRENREIREKYRPPEIEGGEQSS